MSDRREQATFGGGCFWCLEAVFQELRGVESVQSGYAGGSTAEPTYEQVCSGDTGHAEVVRLVYDPDLISYRQLLEVFFSTHDPTTKDRQGADIGTQYRSIILYHDDDQRRMAQDIMAEIEREEIFGAPLVTQVESMSVFWPAEEDHRDYYRRNPAAGYCAAVIAPKLAKFRKTFESLRT
ncbi:MAG TPA: peptide-methionine (S)-S-oxide reductase MsrA [Longimicrobiales bacterium]|nr:peptide-methionine (S)-S-oxide reductase MsrA [Longimicrobiales bacterium]